MEVLFWLVVVAALGLAVLLFIERGRNAALTRECERLHRATIDMNSENDKLHVQLSGAVRKGRYGR